MKNNRTGILKTASRLFTQQGIQRISIEEVASQCSLSKKTFYLFFHSKEELVSNVVEAQLAQSTQHLSTYNGISPDAIIELTNFFECIETMLNVFTPAFLCDVEMYFPGIHMKIKTFADEKMIPFLCQNIHRGITENIYRADLKKDVAAKLYLWELKKAVEEGFVARPYTAQLIGTINNFFIHSLVNSKGKKLLIGK